MFFFQENADISEACTLDDLKRIAVESIVGPKFSHLTYALTNRSNFYSGIPQEYFTTWPLEWVSHYKASEYFRIDPVVKKSLVHTLPIVWDKLEKQERRHPIFREAHDFGVVNGITIPVHSPSGHSGIVSICRQLDTPFITSDDLRELYWFATNIHVRALALISILRNTSKKRALTPREIEAIRLVCNGLTTKQIAKTMHIMIRTVEKHVENAMAKLGAHNRAHMVAIAQNLGLI